MSCEQLDAAFSKMPFGKHKGRTLYDIAASGDVLYLDWLVGQSFLQPGTKSKLEVFLAIPWVSQMVDRELEAKGDQ